MRDVFHLPPLPPAPLPQGERGAIWRLVATELCKSAIGNSLILIAKTLFLESASMATRQVIDLIDRSNVALRLAQCE